MADVLSPDELTDKLAELPGWKSDGNSISKTFAFEDFEQVMRFVNRIAGIAAQQDHHPDIDIRYDKVTLALSTHTAEGVTENDTRMAAAIESLEA